MRRLTAVIAAVALMLGGAVALAAPAAADVTAPANGAVLRGDATLSASGGYDDSPLGVCSGSGDTRIQLINSGGTAVVNQFWDGGGARSITIDTHNYPNGAYTVRAIEHIRYFDWGCKTRTRQTDRSVTIDNITQMAYLGDTTAAQNTTASVSAKLTDPHLAGNVLASRTVSFSLSGGTTVTATTNANGVATASLPISGPPRTATVTASFAQTSFYKGSSASASFVVTKNASTTTIANPATVVHGQPTSFSATVTPGNGTGTPTGTIQFTVDGSNFGSPVSLVNGTAASQSTSTLSTGSHTIGASYSGDGNFFASTAATRTQQVNKAQTTTALTSTGSPTVSGQTVTFTAEVAVVAPGAGTPEGAVQFNVDGQPYGTAVPLTGDEASLSISNLSPGNHQIDATYNGNADYAASSSAALTHGVNRADTSVSLSTSNPDAVAGEPLTFTADVGVVAPGSGNPTGEVQFAVDGENLGDPVPLNGGSATSPVAHLDAGEHLVTANYLGDQNFAGASDSLTQVVDAAATTTTVTSSPNPSVVGQPVTVRAVVAPVAPATGTPAGAVQFLVDGEPEGVFKTLQNGAAEIEIATLSRGSHTITATYYSADPNFVTSTSDPITQTVNKAATKTVVESSSPVSVYGQPVTFTATVSVQAPGAGSPTGTVTFTDGSTVLGTAPVSSSTGFQASITTSSLSVAQHAIVATYDGDDSFLGSDGSVVQKVNRAQTSTVVTSSANPSVSGQAVTFKAAVTPVAPGAGDPTGTVRFTVNGANLGGPATIVDGVATSTAFSSLSPGSYQIEATYSGDGNFVASAGSLEQGTGQGVTKGVTEMTVTADPATAGYGDPVTFTSTVKAVAPATGRPSGVVQIWEGGVLLGASSLSPDGPGKAKATFVTSTLAPGAHEIRAVYVGNYNFEPQTATTSASIGQTPTVTGIESSKNPATFGDDVTFTAVVTEALPAPGEPTGTITFTEGSTVLGTATIETHDGRQQASVTVSGLHAGSHDVVATYSGDAGHAASTSPTYTQQVSRAASGLEAQVIVREVGDNGGRVRATLTGNDGAPLVGETLVFDTTQNTDHNAIHICTVVTDANGYAECDATTEILATILDVGYDVRFGGNADYLPAQDHQTYFYSGD